MTDYVFNTPPGWPEPPMGWRPTLEWLPNPDWPEAPKGWKYWLPASAFVNPPVQPVSPPVSEPASQAPVPSPEPVKAPAVTQRPPTIIVAPDKE